MKAFALKIVLALGFMLVVQLTFGQPSTKPLPTVDDYGKWSTLSQEKIAPDGKWIVYTLLYNLGKDTLFVKHTTTSRQHAIPQGRNAVFSGNSQWLTVHQLDTVLLLNLKTGKQRPIPAATETDFGGASNFLVAFIKKEGSQQLLVLDLDSGKEQKLQEVKEYVLSPDGKSVGFITHSNSVHALLLGKHSQPKTLMESTPENRKHLVWNETGNTLAFMEEINIREPDESTHKIFVIEEVNSNRKIHSLNLENQTGWAMGKKILYNPALTPLLISPDTKRVFFYIKVETKKNEGNGIEIWNSKHPLEYQRNLLEGNPVSRPKLAVWWPDSGRVEEINTNQHPSVNLTHDRLKALIYDPHQYEPQNEIMGPADLWIKDLSTGKSKLFLEKQTRKLGRLGVSPNSRYFNYYRDKHWWAYDVELDKHTLLTKGMENLENTGTYPGGEPPPYGFAGWSKNSQFLIIYSQYDVWLIAADGTSKERLTNGEANGKLFRIVENLTGELKTFHRYDFVGNQFDVDQGLILEAFDMHTKASGYYLWNKKGKLKRLIFKDAKLNRIKKAELTNAFIVVEQKVDVSPQIVFLEGSKKERIVVKTNTHQEQFAWTKAELISYTNSKEAPLQGVLHYPADYQPEKKYPMIVSIYEDQSHFLNNYYNPTLYDLIGFSPANYTTAGYFVLFPDIVYRDGEPGYSAVDCVEAAVKEVLKKGIVQEDRVGLIGHSLGGYQTTFIITQSNLFAAAVAGAGVNDLVGKSLSVNAMGRSEMWRFQTYQMRMGKSLYEDFKGFMKNAPITHAHNIKIPLLSWTGTEDTQVNPLQSIALNMAMRSLNKLNVLILYPDEGHALFNPHFQKDISLKIKGWFDHYLKDKPLPVELR